MTPAGPYRSGDPSRPEIRWVARDSLLVVAALVGLAAQQAWSALNGRPDDIVGAYTALGFAVLLAGLRPLILRGRSSEALGGLAVMILLANLALPLVNSGFLVWTGILPLAAVVIAAPFLDRRLLRPFAAAAWLDAVIGTVFAATGGVIVGGPQSPVGWTIGVSVTVLVVSVLVVRLEEHRRDLILTTAAANEMLESANAEIARSRAQFELLFEETPLPTWVHDLETGRFMAVNHAATEAYGWPRDEFLGLTLDAVSVPRDRLRDDRSAEGMANGVAGERELHRWRDGTVRTVETVGHELSFEGRPARLVTILDVTDRVRAELDHDLLNLSADVVLIADVSGGRVEVQRAAVEGLGLDLEAFRKSVGLDRVHPEDRRATVDAYRRVRAGERIWDFVNRLRDRNGTYHWLSWRIVLDSGRGRIFAVARDITGARLLEARLLHSERMAGIGQLAGGIAHDFNNLITAIRGHADLALVDLPDNEPVRDDLEVIRSAADRARALTGQLLLFSRREAPKPERTSMEQAVKGLAPMLPRLIGEDIELQVEAAAEETPILADRSQLDQVLLNLVVNARDAMPRGGSLILRTGREPVPGSREGASQAVLEVRDCGTGMTDEVRARIFEPFFTTKPAGTGAGLGLASVDRTVRAAGGHIDVQSVPGSGTSFRVVWPSIDVPEAVASPRRSAVAAETALPAPGMRDPDRAAPAPVPGHAPAGPAVLVVEDDQSVRAYAARILERAGYLVLEASGPGEARAVMATGGDAVGLVFSDVVMPGGNGYDLAVELVAARPGLAVLMTSGYDESRVGVAEARAFPFLHKPYGPEELLDRVRAGLLARS